MPIVLNNIPKKRSTILDVGCRYSLLAVQLASLGHKVYGLDLYPYKRKHPNLTFVKGDILNPPLKTRLFDVVIAVSTIEHIGLSFYGEKRNIKGDKKAVKNIHKLLKHGGIFLMTVPYGKVHDTSWYRVYDSERIRNLLSDFKILETKHFKRTGQVWSVEELSKIGRVDSSGNVDAVVFVKAVKNSQIR